MHEANVTYHEKTETQRNPKQSNAGRTHSGHKAIMKGLAGTLLPLCPSVMMQLRWLLTGAGALILDFSVSSSVR
jgi:hypothetical protein